MKTSKTLLVAALAIASTAVAAAPAAATVFVGNTSTAAAVNCTGGHVYVDGDNLGVSGVITEWTLNRPAGTSGQVSLKLVGVDDFFGASHVHNSSALTSVSATGATTMQTRLPANSSEHVGLWHATDQKCRVTAGIGAGESIFTGSDNIADPQGDGGLGTTIALDGAPTAVTNNRLVVKVRIEPDADGDIFGDETQDNCPTVYGANNGCPPVYTPPPNPPAVCTVPNVKGKTKSAATTAIFAAGCKQSKTKLKKIKKFTSKKKKGHVASQTVKAGTVLPFGSTVGITVYAKKS
jgi:PASTA domain